MFRKLRRFFDLRRLRQRTIPTDVRQVYLPTAAAARKWRNEVEHDMIVSRLMEVHDAIAMGGTSCSLDVSELSPTFTEQLAVALSGLGYEIEWGHNGKKERIRMVVHW